MFRRATQSIASVALVVLFAQSCSVPEFGFDQSDQPDACSGGDCGCQPGFADCDLLPENGCETDTRNSQIHCGTCETSCSPDFCSGGKCTSLECPEGFADCDRQPENGCEANLASTATCGGCSNPCSSIHGTPACTAGVCRISCEAGYDDCDLDVKTGCETSVTADVDHCGRCDISCTNEHGSTVCEESTCAPVCAVGFESCDGDLNNGCEVDLGSSLAHCGDCGRPCNLPHASETCDNGVCRIVACEEGFEDCDTNEATGCEASLASPDTCGDCATKCSSNGGTAACTAEACSITCLPDHFDCNTNLIDGCEVDLSINVQNCGTCRNVCPAGAGTPVCDNKVCRISTCNLPFADCNNDNTQPGGDGCETNTSNNPQNCGGCGLSCTRPNGVTSCTSSNCVLVSCNTNWDDCNDDARDGCEIRIDRTDNCGACGVRCTNANGTTACIAGVCKPSCEIGFGDCDNNPNDGCDFALTSLVNCGACGVPCALAHASESCSSGSCEIVQCDPGWGNCDNEPALKTGCETNTRTLTDCGTCGTPCNLAHASESCSTGTCAIVQCDPGWGNCNGIPGDGCETPLNTLTHCGTCGTGCSLAHASESCSTGTCEIVQCDAGWATCDNEAALRTGCERDIRTLSDCGGCGTACNLAHATESCGSGTCTFGTCDTGWASCDGTTTNGCERSVSADVLNCGACNRMCSTVNGTPGCAGGNCSIVCNAGWGNCDNNVTNGCEHDTSDDPTHCGTCPIVCSGATPFCANRACAVQGAIKLVNSATVGSAASNLTLPHALQTPAGKYRMVLVMVASDGNSQGSATPDAARYNNVDMQLLHYRWSSNRAFSGIYGIKEAALPATPGTYNVQITGVESNVIANVYELKFVEQPTPVDAVGGSAGSNCCCDDPSDAITVGTNGAWIFSTVSTFGTGAGTAGSSQIETHFNTVSQLGFKAGYLGPVNASSRTIGWDMASCNASAHALVALRPVTTP